MEAQKHIILSSWCFLLLISQISAGTQHASPETAPRVDLFKVNLKVRSPRTSESGGKWYISLLVIAAEKNDYKVSKTETEGNYTLNFGPNALIGATFSEFDTQKDLDKFIDQFIIKPENKKLDLFTDSNWPIYTTSLPNTNYRFKKVDLGTEFSSFEFEDNEFRFKIEGNEALEGFNFYFTILFSEDEPHFKIDEIGFEKETHKKYLHLRLLKREWTNEELIKFGFKSKIEKPVDPQPQGDGHEGAVSDLDSIEDESSEKNASETSEDEKVGDKKGKWSVWYTIGIVFAFIFVVLALGWVLAKNRSRTNRKKKRFIGNLENGC